MQKSSKQKRLSREQAHKRCEIVTGKKVVDANYPGGKSRESWRVILDAGESLIATRRRSPLRANLEIKILEALSKHEVPSPKLIAKTDWKLFFQEDLQGRRLSEAIIRSDESTANDLLDSALDGLARAQKAASYEGLDRQVPIIGAKKDWIIELLERPYPIGNFFNKPAPALDLTALYPLLRVKKPRFVKWDARPGNAIVRKDGSVAWYDWEHAGARNRLDDMVWLLADEFVPDYPDIENALIERHLPQFADEKNVEEAYNYLMVYGTFHMLIRLGLILTYKTQDKEEWWDINYCVDKDKIGITLECAQRTCLRAARWSQHSPLTRPLSPWFLDISKSLEDL